jgi:hypothetical protein
MGYYFITLTQVASLEFWQSSKGKGDFRRLARKKGGAREVIGDSVGVGKNNISTNLL